MPSRYVDLVKDGLEGKGEDDEVRRGRCCTGQASRSKEVPHDNRACSSAKTPGSFTSPIPSGMSLPINSAFRTDLGWFTDVDGDIDEFCSLDVINAEVEADWAQGWLFDAVK